MMCAMLLSIVFIVVDVLSVTGALSSSLPVGINPFWKLNFVFKCLTDAVILDDFKTALDRLRAFKMSRLGSFAVDNSDDRSRPDGALERVWEAGRKSRSAPETSSSNNPFAQAKAREWDPEINHMDVLSPSFGPTASRDGDVKEKDVVLEPADTSGNVSPRELDLPRPSISPRNTTFWQDQERITSSEYARAVKEITDEPPTPDHVSKK